MLIRSCLGLLAVLSVAGAWGEAQWYKGATHLHSLWSDGNAAPEFIIDWYLDHGWDFVCPSDHNVLMEGERYFPVKEDSRLTEERVTELQEMFGTEWVELRGSEGGGQEMRLKTLEELRARFTKPGEFILIQAEEMTTLGGNPHINAINLREAVPGIKAEDKPKHALIQHYLDNIAAQREKYNVPMIAHLNHVNFADRITTEEMLKVKGLYFFEVYNGHPSVHSWGIESAGVPSGERHWDVTLAMKQRRDPGYLLYGVATDDSHSYFSYGPKDSNPGRGWVMVRSETLEPDAIVAAMQAGDFYGSTGVTLSDVRNDGKSLGVTIEGEPGVTYTTQYVGTRKGFDTEARPRLDDNGKPLPRSTLIYSDAIGEVLHETKDLESTYTFDGDELYVRARVVSDAIQDNPHREGDLEMAWVQPVLPR